MTQVEKPGERRVIPLSSWKLIKSISRHEFRHARNEFVYAKPLFSEDHSKSEAGEVLQSKERGGGGGGGGGGKRI